jgi:hypothetical protein
VFRYTLRLQARAEELHKLQTVEEEVASARLSIAQVGAHYHGLDTCISHARARTRTHTHTRTHAHCSAQLGSSILADPEKNTKALRQLAHWCARLAPDRRTHPT